MIDHNANRDAEIRLRHTKHGNSVRMLARFYDLSTDEISTILRQPLVKLPIAKTAHTQAISPNAADCLSDEVSEADWKVQYEQSVDELIMWIAGMHHIRKDQFGERLDGSALEARRMLSFNLRRRWGAPIEDVAARLDVSNKRARKLDSECQNHQRPPVEPPEPRLPGQYLDELRKVAKRFKTTPLAVFQGSTEYHQSARREFLQRMFWQHDIEICDIAKATGFFASRIHKQVHRKEVF